MTSRTRVNRRLARGAACALGLALLIAVSGVPTWANHEDAQGSSFLVLAAGFTQDLFGVSQLIFPDDRILGGVAFATGADPAVPLSASGDPFVSECDLSGTPLHRFIRQGTVAEPANHQSELHPEAIAASAAGCGIVNHPDGFIYSNTEFGLVRLNGATGAVVAGPPLFPPGLSQDPPGNALSIAVHPGTQHIYYGSPGCGVADPSPCEIHEFCLMAGKVRTVGLLAADSTFIDGMYFDPSGSFLFIANREWNGQPVDQLGVPTQWRLTILRDSDLGVERHVPMTHEPDGVAFHPGDPMVVGDEFVVTNNTNNPGPDGTMSRFDFANNNFLAPPAGPPTAETPFASGGFRGDLMQVGADGCIYLTQAGTRYDDSPPPTFPSTNENSLVKICGGFVPPPGTPAFGEEPPPPPPEDPVVVFTKTTSAAVNPGNLLHYKLSYANIGPAPSQSAVITDYLPTQVTFVSASNGGVYNAGARTVTWNLGTVPISQGSRDLVVRVPSATPVGTVIANRAEFTGLLTTAPPATAATVVVPR